MRTKIYYTIFLFLLASCGSNEFDIDEYHLTILGKDSPIRCIDINNDSNDSLEFYTIKNFNSKSRYVISITSPPEGYIITNCKGDTIRNIVFKKGHQYSITNSSVYDASSITHSFQYFSINN